MTFESELYHSLADAFLSRHAKGETSPAPLDWNGYECVLFGDGFVGMRISDHNGEVGVLINNGKALWQTEPSPEQLMKLRLLV